MTGNKDREPNWNQIHYALARKSFRVGTALTAIGILVSIVLSFASSKDKGNERKDASSASASEISSPSISLAAPPSATGQESSSGSALTSSVNPKPTPIPNVDEPVVRRPSVPLPLAAPSTSIAAPPKVQNYDGIEFTITKVLSSGQNLEIDFTASNIGAERKRLLVGGSYGTKIIYDNNFYPASETLLGGQMQNDKYAMQYLDHGDSIAGQVRFNLFDADASKLQSLKLACSTDGQAPHSCVSFSLK